MAAGPQGKGTAEIAENAEGRGAAHTTTFLPFWRNLREESVYVPVSRRGRLDVGWTDLQIGMTVEADPNAMPSRTTRIGGARNAVKSTKPASVAAKSDGLITALIQTGS